MQVVALVAGVVLTLATFLALCQAMLVPRKSNSIIVRLVNGLVSRVALSPLPLMRTYRAQDRWLSGVAPISVLLALIVYVMVLIFTLGLVVYGTSDLTMLESLYQSGSTLTTLGIVEAVNPASAITTFVAAFLGLVVIAVFIGYLLAIYGAFVARESGMARIAMLAGEPAWGPVLVARGYILRLPPDEVPDAARWIDWICDTRLNAQVNPVLMRFRSTSSKRHWVTTMMAILDAAALRVSISKNDPDPHLVQLLTEGTLTMATLAHRDGADAAAEVALHNWDLEKSILSAVHDDPTGVAPPTCGVARAEFDDSLEMIARAGAELPVPGHRIWERFASIRAVYFANGAALAQEFHAVPAPWSGPRHPALAVEYPERPGSV